MGNPRHHSHHRHCRIQRNRCHRPCLHLREPGGSHACRGRTHDLDRRHADPNGHRCRDAELFARNAHPHHCGGESRAYRHRVADPFRPYLRREPQRRRPCRRHRRHPRCVPYHHPRQHRHRYRNRHGNRNRNRIRNSQCRHLPSSHCICPH